MATTTTHSPPRLERADTVVFLATPWFLCARRAFLRGLRQPRRQLPDGCQDTAWRYLRDEWLLAARIWHNRHIEPRLERDIIGQHGRHATLHVLRSEQDASRLLERASVQGW